jgi:hypothetical protein
VRPFKTSLFQGGYVDFRVWERQMSSPKGPPRTSFLEDFCFYTQYHSDLVEYDKLHALPILILKKIVVGHYIKLIDYIGVVMSYRHYKTLSYWESLPLEVPLVE